MQLCIPDDPLWIAEFSGVLLQLTRGYWWNDGEAKQDVIDLAKAAYRSWQLQEGECMDWCTVIADCLSDPNSPANAAVRAITGSGNGYPVNEPLPDGKQNEDFLDSAETNPSCDLDVLWGQCLYIVQMTNRVITDFLEQFETYTNSVEFAAVLGKLPVADEIGIDAIISYAAFLQNVIAENYAAQYTADLENTIACKIFCLAQDTCEVSINDIATLLSDELGLSIPAGFVYDDLLDALAGLPIEGTSVVYAMFTLAWQGLRIANVVLQGVGDQALKVAVQLGSDNPSSDWTVLCEDCNPSYLLYDFDVANQGFALVNGNRGAYVPPYNTVRFNDGSAYYIAVHAYRAVTGNASIARIEMDIEMTAGTQQASPYSRVQVMQSNNTSVISNVTIQTGQLAAGNHTIGYDFTTPLAVLTGQIIRFDRWLYDNANSVTSGYATAKVHRVRLYFDGIIPTGWGGEIVND
jgi:hypothetical protein